MQKQKQRNINTKKPSNTRLFDISLNNYVRPDYKKTYQASGEYILNGDNNDYYEYVEQRYYGSPTNAAITDSYCRYIYGDGLMVNGAQDSQIISTKEVQLLIKDFKQQGQCALQVIYSTDRSRVIELAYLPIKSIGVAKPVAGEELDLNQDPKFYYYCYDWNYKNKFKPVLIPAFGTSSEGTEILVIRSISNLPYFSLPDYQSGLQYAQIEEELSNYFINHIQNGLSFGHIINIYGVEDSEESQNTAEKYFKDKLTGSKNAGKFILSFQDDPNKKTTVESLEVSDAHEQYQFLATEARDKILMAHKVTNPILFGVEKATGFSNNADEMVVALKTLYRSQINPLREEIIDGLKLVFQVNDPNVQLYFEDFEELRVKEEPTQLPDNDTLITE